MNKWSFRLYTFVELAPLVCWWIIVIIFLRTIIQLVCGSPTECKSPIFNSTYSRHSLKGPELTEVYCMPSGTATPILGTRFAYQLRRGNTYFFTFLLFLSINSFYSTLRDNPLLKLALGKDYTHIFCFFFVDIPGRASYLQRSLVT